MVQKERWRERHGCRPGGMGGSACVPTHHCARTTQRQPSAPCRLCSCPACTPQDPLPLYAGQLSAVTLVCLVGHVVGVFQGLVPGQHIDLPMQSLYFMFVFTAFTISHSW